MKNAIYPLSLIVIAVAIYLAMEFPESGRMNMIAGGLIALGFMLNISGYLLLKGRLSKTQ